MNIQVEKENLEYAELLMQDYAGHLGALSCILGYAYQQMIQPVQEDVLAEQLYQIQKKKMRQLELFGKLILLLGGNPQYGTFDSRIRSRIVPYTTCGLCYQQNCKEFLEKDLKREEQIYQQFQIHQKTIKDVYIHSVFDFLLEDQQEIMTLLKKCMEKDLSH